MKNIACNLIYNNGGEDYNVGFAKRCDIKNIILNVETDNKRWCSQPECSCKQYYDSGFRITPLDYPCNESELFQKWEWNPGNEFATGRPFRMLSTGSGKIAILTTRFAGAPESERKIIGFLKILTIVQDGHRLIASPSDSLRLALDEAQELNFWNYHRNTKSDIPMWRQGRFRYLEDIQVAAILHDLKEVVRNDTTKSLLSNLIENDFNEYATTRPNVYGALQENTKKKFFLKRKYGKGGESKEHKQLKEYIAANPNTIGLSPKEVNASVEHQYLSGDLVDILFKSMNNLIDTVVEIELNNVEPGIHQAIKYRVLRCAQRGLSLDSNLVKSTVVAWKLKESEKALCRKYHIDYFEIDIRT